MEQPEPKRRRVSSNNNGPTRHVVPCSPSGFSPPRWPARPLQSTQQQQQRQQESVIEPTKTAEGSPISPAVVPAAAAAAAASNPREEISKLLVEMQQDTFEDAYAALEELSELLGDDDAQIDRENEQTMAIQLGAIGMIVKFMQKWHEKPLGLAFDMLGILAEIDNVAVAKSGATLLIVSNMLKFPNDQQLQSAAFYALGMTFPGECWAPRPIPTLTKKFVHQNLPQVVAAMMKWPDDAFLQNNACFLLANLSNDTKHHEMLVQAGAASAVATSLEHHQEHLDISKWARLFLSNLFPRCD